MTLTPPSSPVDRPRKPRTPLVLEVVATERLSASLTRVRLGGAGVEQFLTQADPERLAATDKYVKLLFAKPELGLQPPYDLDALRETLAPEDLPSRRTYTVRDVDLEGRTIAIDFVVHGDDGIAGPWAASAQPGDLLCLSGPGGKFLPTQDAAVHRLYVGDESAVPAIAAALEAAPADAVGSVLIEVDGPDDEVALRAPAGVRVRWVHRSESDVVTEVSGLTPPDAPVEAFVHGERGQVRALGTHLQRVWGLSRTDMSLSAYWARGRAEDRFQSEKREPIGQLFDDPA